MQGEGSPRLSRLIVLIAFFVLVGTPLVAYLWETTNVLMSGQIRPLQLGIAVVLLPIFLVVLRALANRIHAVEGRRAQLPGVPSEPPQEHR